MGDIISNNIVKMDWSKKGWAKFSGTFYCASQEYETESGDSIAVFFTPNEAFVWADGGDISDITNLWSVNDLIPWIKENGDGTFPHAYEEFQRISTTDEALPEKLEALGISKWADDINARLEDISHMGDTREGAV